MTVKLTDEQWQKILPVLKTCPHIRLGAGRDVRRFLEAVLWVHSFGSAMAALAANVRQLYERYTKKWSSDPCKMMAVEKFVRLELKRAQ